MRPRHQLLRGVPYTSLLQVSNGINRADFLDPGLETCSTQRMGRARCDGDHKEINAVGMVVDSVEVASRRFRKRRDAASTFMNGKRRGVAGDAAILAAAGTIRYAWGLVRTIIDGTLPACSW